MARKGNPISVTNNSTTTTVVKNSSLSAIYGREVHTMKACRRKKSSMSSHVCYPFLVAAIQTIWENEMPLQSFASYIVITPDGGENLTKNITTFYRHRTASDTGDFRAQKFVVLKSFLTSLTKCALEDKKNRVYLANFKDEATFIMQDFVARGRDFRCRSVKRKGRICEIQIFIGVRLLLSFRDSMQGPNSMRCLGSSLCSEKVDKIHIEVDPSLPPEILKNLVLFGYIILAAQTTFWFHYKKDVITCQPTTLAVAMKLAILDSEKQPTTAKASPYAVTSARAKHQKLGCFGCANKKLADFLSTLILKEREEALRKLKRQGGINQKSNSPIGRYTEDGQGRSFFMQI